MTKLKAVSRLGILAVQIPVIISFRYIDPFWKGFGVGMISLLCFTGLLFVLFSGRFEKGQP